jgi:hypothetical protein
VSITLLSQVVAVVVGGMLLEAVVLVDSVLDLLYQLRRELNTPSQLVLVALVGQVPRLETRDQMDQIQFLALLPQQAAGLDQMAFLPTLAVPL